MSYIFQKTADQFLILISTTAKGEQVDIFYYLKLGIANIIATVYNHYL